MELAYIWIIPIGLLLLGTAIFFGIRGFGKSKFNKGVKVANADMVEQTPYFKKQMFKFRFYRILMASSLAGCILVSVFLAARPVEVKMVDPGGEKRDIFICLDISDSVDEVNLEICKQLKNMVDELDGQRFGITIFNARSVLLVPLTTDYSYVQDTLDTLIACIKQNIRLSGDIFDITQIDYSLYNYKYDGTLSDTGSSYIGDGLASTLFDFPDLDTDPDRSRIIIFATDNELNGVPIVTVSEATELCKKHSVKVYAIAPSNIVDESNFKSDIESTGGKYYRADSTSIVKDIVNSIKKEQTSKTVELKTILVDCPEVLFIILLVLIVVYWFSLFRIKA